MDSALLPLLVFAPFFLVLLCLGLRRRACPDCGGLLWGFQSPLTKTRRQWVEGGCVCGQCGCETDLAGVRVPGDRPVKSAVPGLLLVAAALVPGVVLGAVLLLWHG
jgi:hypothetical protein